MNRRIIRQLVAVLVIISTVAVFVLYISKYPETIRQLTILPLSTLGLLLLLYAVFLGSLAWIQRATLSLCDINLGRKESLLLIAYSSIINFFGPLQSGPAFRAAYLKRKHNVKLTNYSFATLLYYIFYAIFSGLFIATYYIGLWALLVAVLIIGLAPFLLRIQRLVPARLSVLKLQHVSQLALASLAQVSIFAVIFYIELNSFGHHAGLIPALIYTGAANFALFVSLTPGAIGFRESFVLFTQQLHHIPSTQIVTASLIDRGAYILFLGILAVLVFGIHAQNYLTSAGFHKDAVK